MRRVTAELALGQAEVFVAGSGGLSEIRLIAFRGFFSNRVLTSVRPKDSAALGTLNDSLRYPRLDSYFRSACKRLTLVPDCHPLQPKRV
jgi:hypothetical protein